MEKLVQRGDFALFKHNNNNKIFYTVNLKNEIVFTSLDFSTAEHYILFDV